MTPRFLSKDIVLGLHGIQLRDHGGGFGIRDEAMLESAIAKPQNLHAYGETSILKMAASLGYGLIMNHPFVDGNKRTGLHATIVFLELNGLSFNASEAEAVAVVLSVAANEIDQDGYEEWLSDSCS